MNKNETYVYAGLATVLGAALGLLFSIFYQKNIPLSLLIGGGVGLFIGSVIMYLLYLLRNNNKKDE